MFKLAQGMCVFMLIAAALLAQTTTPPPAQVTLTSGIVGVAEGQTARLNALNPGVAPPAVGVICSGLLSFVGDDGTVLKSLTVNVAPGTSQPLVIDSVKDLALAGEERKELRATIMIPPILPPSATSTSSPTPVTPLCKLIGTLEVYNTGDGRTQVTLGTVHLVPSPVVAPAE